MKFITAKPINTLRTIAFGLALAACIGGFASIASSAAAKAKDVKADVVYLRLHGGQRPIPGAGVRD